MGQIVLILGRSGTGKSTSLRNFGENEVGVFNVAGKMLPFRKKLPVIDNAGYEQIGYTLNSGQFPSYVIDDAGYLMQFENFAKAREKGYEKFTTMAQNFEGLLRAARMASPTTITYFVMHPEADANGDDKVKTIGKMLDEKLCIEGLFPIVLVSDRIADDGGSSRYVFWTNEHGLAKSPMGMFDELTIDNDLKKVDDVIRDYWALPREREER